MRTIDLSGKSALITGGTRGIGRSIAQTLAEAGADVALFYLSNDDAATRAREEIQASTGRRAEIYRVDVRFEEAVEDGVARALSDFGGAFHVLVHNAGHGRNSTMPEVDTEAWRGTLAVNLDAAFFLSRALLRAEGGFPSGGSMIFIGSGRGHDPCAGLSPYCTAKAAQVHFAAMLAQDVGPRGVRVNVVSPGYIELPHYVLPEEEKQSIREAAALRRLGQPEDVAGAVLFFASDLSSYITGQWIRVNGGTV